MTVAATPCVVEYRVERASLNQRWPLPFAYMAAEHVTAALTPQTQGASARQLQQGADFSVIGQEAVTHIPLPVGARLRFARTTPAEQPILWVQGQTIDTLAIMHACDRLTMLVQELAARVEGVESK